MSKTDETFKTGDIVYLKSGSHPMTYAESAPELAINRPEYDFVRVAWGDENSGIDDSHISPRCLTATPTPLPSDEAPAHESITPASMHAILAEHQEDA